MSALASQSGAWCGLPGYKGLHWSGSRKLVRGWPNWCLCATECGLAELIPTSQCAFVTSDYLGQTLRFDRGFRRSITWTRLLDALEAGAGRRHWPGMCLS
jgi:hypothetical protein